MMSVNMKRAYKEMMKISRKLTVEHFGDIFVRVVCEDGSVFFLNSAFTQGWWDPDGNKWLFVFCEHYPDMVFDQDDLIAWYDLRHKED
jgi:hypothetical protein